MRVQLIPFWSLLLFCSCSGIGQSTPEKNAGFTKQQISGGYISEGVATADVNKDGKIDILSGSFWWQAPDWKMHEITTPYIHPSIDGYGHSFLNFTMDVNMDGWEDMIRIGFPGEEALWYENPKNEPGRWKERIVYPSVGNESPALTDVDGDGRPDLLCNDAVNKKVIWLSAPSTLQDTVWTVHVISNDSLRGTHEFTHGLGLGDVNGDSRKDVIINEGWWEAPVNRKQEDWLFHPAAFGADCAQMYTLDVDKDGDNDIISSSAHDYGIWWYEQRRADTVSWVKHNIYNKFSQSHGLTLEDIDNDGQPDLITGKRFWAHNGHDRGETEPAVLYWFGFKAGTTPRWIPHQVDNNSGVGLQVVVRDMNGDSKKDIIVGNKKGVFLFTQE